MERKCQNCGNEINNKDLNKKFCDRKCYFEFARKNKTIGKKKDLSTRETRTCKICNKEFIEYKKKKRLFCSDECRKIWNKINSKERCEKSLKSNIEKNGGVHFFKTTEFKNKSDLTKLKKYGTIKHMDISEIKEKQKQSFSKKTQEEKKITENKRKQTKLEKYDDENYNNRDKFKKTIIEKYGDFHLKIDEIKIKSENTMIKNYGVSNPLKIKEIRENAIKAQKEKYGSLYVQSEEYKQKTFDLRINKVKERVELLNLNFIDFVDGEYVVIECKECGNIFTHSQYFRNYDIKCRKCHPIIYHNSLNVFIENFLKEYNINYQINNDKILNGLEIDYYLPDINVGIELNGNYYHSEINGKKNKKYHINKTIKTSENKIKLIHIFEDEIKLQPNIVKSRLKSIFGIIHNKIYARNCVIKEVDKKTSLNFINENHIQGYVQSKYQYALYYNGIIVSIMTFGKRRITINKNKNENEYELLRFTNVNDVIVIGGFSKLLKHFIKKIKPEKIITYADVRWSGINPEKTVYAKNNFKFIQITKPNYWYVSKKNFLDRKHRFAYRKDVLVKEGYDPNKTEWEIMKERGYDRIWDCGSLKFEMIC